MPFGTITSNSKTFEPRNPGVYSESSTDFASPQNEYRLRGGSTRKDKSLTAGVTRVMQKDVSVGVLTTRQQAIVSLSITIPGGPAFTPADIDSMALDISNFIAPDTVSRLLQGEE